MRGKSGTHYLAPKIPGILVEKIDGKEMFRSIAREVGLTPSIYLKD